MAGSAKPNNEKSITLLPTQEQKKSSEGSDDWLIDELTLLGEAFGEALTAERQAIYAGALADVPKADLLLAMRKAVNELKWFPKVAELREIVGALSAASDDRPGPEEAWARMPKGERMEEETVVWCREEQNAYSACRSLLLEGDLIGARMAFKERYEKELSNARSQRRSAEWIVSAGSDKESRLTALVTAVKQNRISIESALNYVPLEQQTEFWGMLPAARIKGLLAGQTKEVPDLPGLPGLLARMEMDGLLPDELKAPPRPQLRTPLERSDDEVRMLREKANAQRELLKRKYGFGENGNH